MGEPIGESRRYRVARNGEGAAEGSARTQEITVMLVDPRPWTQEALAQALETGCPDFRVLRFGDVSELAKAALPGSAGVVLLNVPGLGLADRLVSATVASARASLPKLPVVVLSESADAEDILGAIERGLSGYIPLSSELRVVIDALRFVAAGGTFVPEELLTHLIAARPAGSPPEPSLEEPASVAPVHDAALLGAALNMLTPREVTVLARLREGKSNKQIAQEIGMREATVKVHVRHIMRKLGAVNRTQVALLADVAADRIS